MSTIAEEGFVMIEEDHERVLDMEMEDFVEENIPEAVENVVPNEADEVGSPVSGLRRENESLRQTVEDRARAINELQDENDRLKGILANVNESRRGSRSEGDDGSAERGCALSGFELDNIEGEGYPWNEDPEYFGNEPRGNEEGYRGCDRNDSDRRYQQGNSSHHYNGGNTTYDRNEVTRGNSQRNDDRWEHEQYHHGDDGYSHHREARTESGYDEYRWENAQNHQQYGTRGSNSTTRFNANLPWDVNLVEGERFERAFLAGGGADQDNRRLNQNQWNRFGSLLDRPPVSGTGSRISIERWLQLPLYVRKLAHDGGKAPIKKCKFCQEWRHFPADCPRYPTLEQRLRRARELGLCVNCLRYHRGSHCGHLNACFKCTIGQYNGWDKHHHQAICPFNF